MTKPGPMIAGCVVLMAATLAQGLQARQEDESPGTPLHLSISIPQTRFILGEPIRVKVELSNHGTTPVFVGSEIPANVSWIYYLMVSVEDSEGNTSPFTWGFFDRSPPDFEESFANALANAWIALPPGYSYVTTIEIDSDMFEFLKKPGRYRLKAKYVSSGMDAPLHYNALAKYRDETARLPFPSWKGEVEGNSLWIEIIRQRTSESGH